MATIISIFLFVLNNKEVEQRTELAFAPNHPISELLISPDYVIIV